MHRPSHIVPTISAYTYMHGQHDFNKMLLAPMGCTVLLHNKPDFRKTWDDYAIEGYYVESSKANYWCYKIWVKNIRSIHIADTMFFKHKHITMSTITKTDAIVEVGTTLAKVLLGEILANIGKNNAA